MEADRSLIMEAFRNRFTAAEIQSYKEVLYEAATEGWYAPYDPKEVEREECNCTHLARQFFHLVEVYRERFFTYVLLQLLRHSAATYLERYLLHVHYTSKFDGDDGDDKDQLELDWITWQRDYMQDRAWSESRTSILEAMQCNLNRGRDSDW